MPALRQGTTRLFSERAGGATVEAALAWLDEAAAPGQPVFMFLHLYEPHTPYEAPEPFRSRYAPYDAEVATADALVGRFLEELRARGLYDDALIVLLSDHGEGLGDHGESEHGIFLYREALQVPLMIRLPGGERGGTRVSDPVGLIDIAPTLLARAGVRDLLGEGIDLLRDDGIGTKRPLYGESLHGREQFGWAELRSVILGDLHYIDAPRPELYHLVRDPAETDNRLPGERVPASMLRALRDVGEGREARAEVPVDQLERLASLGYVGGHARGRLPGIDPKDGIERAEELWRSIRRIGQNDSLAAERRVVALLAELGVRNEALARVVARNALHAGRAELAREVLAPFAHSAASRTRQLLGEALTLLGRRDEARDHFDAILEHVPDDPRAHLGLGVLALSGGDVSMAEQYLRRAVALDDSLSEAWNALGALESERGRHPEAIDCWRRAVAADPEYGDAWFNLGLAAGRAGDPELARKALQRYRDLVSGPDREEAERLLAGL